MSFVWVTKVYIPQRLIHFFPVCVWTWVKKKLTFIWTKMLWSFKTPGHFTSYMDGSPLHYEKICISLMIWTRKPPSPGHKVLCVSIYISLVSVLLRCTEPDHVCPWLLLLCSGSCPQVSTLIPGHFQEWLIQVYCKRTDVEGEILRAAWDRLENWRQTQVIIYCLVVQSFQIRLFYYAVAW